MSVAEIAEMIGIIAIGAAFLAYIIVSILKGEMRDFILKKMVEAEESGKSGKEKLEFVLEAVKEKYKILATANAIKAFVEKIIEATKKINAKGE